MSIHQIKEYGKIYSDKDFKALVQSESEITIPEKSFNSIWNYILEFQTIDPLIEKAFKLSTRGGKRLIQAQNYVGLIETSQKEIVEILPKIYSKGKEADISSCKEVFFKMVATLKNAPFINIQKAGLDVESDFPILEVFIGSFIAEVEQLVLKGLKKGYLKVEKNSAFLKGQLLFSKNLLQNLVDNSKFFIKYTDYQLDIPQNRVLKRALEKLNYISSSFRNKVKIRSLLIFFETISPSANLTSDINLSKANSRLFSDYLDVLSWAEIFLTDKSFTAFSGKNINQALLFPMQSLFESYVARNFMKYAEDYTIHIKHNKLFLVDDHKNKSRFNLQPDLYLISNNDKKERIILDTKWKIIDESNFSGNYLIKQSDMYQLYAYGRKYIIDNIPPKMILIYPMNKTFLNTLPSFRYESIENENHLKLTAFPYDLLGNNRTQVESIINNI